MKRIVQCAVLGLSLLAAAQARATIGWGYETWNDTTPLDGSVDEWGRFQVSFTPGSSSDGPNTVGVADIDNGQGYGKVYYGTGLSSTQITSQFKYLYVEYFDIKGDAKLALSGPGDSDFFIASNGLRLVASSGPTGSASSSDVIFNPGQYVFDVSNWTPSAAIANTTVQLFGEGDPANPNQGFTVRRLFFTDNLADTKLAAVPEPSSAALGLMGVAGLIGACLRRRSK